SYPHRLSDKSAEQGFCKFFKALPEKPDTLLRLFERNGGDYYSVHGEDALFVAQAVYKTSSVIKYLGADAPRGLPSCTLSKLNANSLLRDLLMVKLYRVEIWGGGANRGKWEIVKKASPGNLQAVEEMLFSNHVVSSSPVVLAVKVGTRGEQKLVGIAYSDATINRVLGVAEFVDNDTFSNFESLLIQLSVKECVIPDDSQSYELKKMVTILNRCQVVVTERKKVDFGIANVEQDLDRLIDGLGEERTASSLPEFEFKLAMGCTACLIKYLDLMGDESNFHQYSLTQHDLAQFMKLDAAAVKALNLMPGPMDGSNKNMSLYGLLNNCQTAQGSRMLAQWLKQPLLSLPDIEMRQTLVEVFCNDTELRQGLQEEHLKRFPDLHRLCKKFQRGKATLQDVIVVYQVVIRLPALNDLLQDYSGDNADVITEVYTAQLKEYIENLAKFRDLVESTIDLDAIENNQFMVKPDFDESLLHARQKMDEIFAQMEPEAERVADSLGLQYGQKLKFENSPQYGYHMRVTRADSGAVRNKKYIELATRNNGILFQTRELQDLSNEFMDLSAEYQRLQANFANEIISVVLSFTTIFEITNELVAHLDVILR
ncbi:DNA mismatch repair protein muts, partial [Blyttiomyces helicus]